MVFFIDYENVYLYGLEGISALSKFDEVQIFCRRDNLKRIHSHLRAHPTKALVKVIPVQAKSKNAVDFSIVTAASLLKKSEIRVIVSKDTGFDAAVEMMMRSSILAFRTSYIGDRSCLKNMQFFGQQIVIAP